MLRSHFAACCGLAFLAAMPTWARACWTAAAQRYGVPAELLYAIARTESNLDPLAVNRTHIQRTGSYDIGLMQINSGHLRSLARYGIRESDLYDPCTNLQVGAWLLAGNIARRGLSWDAVGAYNAACSRLHGKACTQARSRYAWQVYRRLPAQQSVTSLVSARSSPKRNPPQVTAPFQLAVRVLP